MNPDILVRTVLILCTAGTAISVAAILMEFIYLPRRNETRHRLTNWMCVSGVAMIALALICNFIFIVTIR